MNTNLFRTKVFKNFSYLTIGSAISQIVSLFTILKIAHTINPAEYGLFSFLTVQGALLLTIADLGLKNIIIRTIARNPLQTNDLIFNASILRSTALIFLTILYLLYNDLFGNLTVYQVIMVFAFALFNCFSNLFENTFYGREKMFTPSLINLLYSLSWFAGVSFLNKASFNVTNLFYIFLFLNGLKAFSYFFLLKSQQLLIGLRGNFRMSSMRLFSESWPYFVMVLIMLPVTHLSNNFLDLNSTIDEVGYFNLSQKFMGPVSLTITIALNVIFPNLSSLWVKDQSKFYHYVSLGIKWFMIFTGVLCFLFALFAQELFTLLFPVGYLAAVKVCQMQIWYLFLTSIDSLIGTILGATNHEKIILRFGILYFVFCTPVFFYASQYGALGLSYGYVISFGICLVYVWHIFKKTLQIQISYTSLIWVLALLLFLISGLIPVDFSLIYKILISIAVLAGAIFYFLKTFKVATIK